MDFFFMPSRKPTPGEYSVLTIAFCLLLFALGGAALALGLTAAPEKAEAANEAVRYGVISIGLGLAILIGRWLIRRWLASG